MQASPVVEVNELSFSYGTNQVLNGLSLSVKEGEIFGVLGANGSGKTTLMRIMVGLLSRDGGTLEVYGESPSPQQAGQVGYMPQLNALYQELSVRENVDFFARMYGMSDRGSRAQSVADAIELVGLTSQIGEPVLKLSGGMRQRVSLAITLVHRPSLLLLDEPTVGLDPDLRVMFWEHFRRMAESGTTIIISSHTMDDAAHCDRLAFLRDGRVIALDTPSALRAASGRPDDSLEDAFIHFLRMSDD
ncbi:MAG: ABC transporter ATP-binding protein [Dehalococcoidia bacterium]|nr:ABC transporter ATP-binding protein [Dehalococcoidia bacterium]